MSNQLIKTTEQGKENVFPRTRIQDLFDETSGQKLIDILNSFNMMFVPYLGNKFQTRNQVSPELRRQGLWLTYVIDNTVYTEWYDGVAIDNTNWGSDSNWRQGSNALVGDLSISPNGTWVINGEDSGITIKGDKGDSPVIRIYNNKIQVSYDKGVTYEDLNNTPVYTKFRFNSQTNTYQVSYDLGANWQDISNEKVYHKFKYNQTTNTYQESTDFGKTWSNISAEKVYTKFRFNRSTNTYQVSTDLGQNWTDVSSDKVYYQFRYNGETNTHQVSTDFGTTWANVSEDKVFYQFRTNDNRLQVSTDLGNTWKNCSEPIAAWFRWTDTSGTGNVGKIQISRDNETWSDLSPNIVNNVADEEDLTSLNVDSTNVLKFKDKEYNPLTYSGMGRKILRKNLVNSVNTLTQSMINQANTVYVIQYDFTLGEDITVPENCILEFDGGSINNGKISGTTLSIHGNGAKFENLHIVINGNCNIIKDFVIHRTSKSQSPSMIYYPTSLNVTGNNNYISNIETYYQDGPGLSVSGKNNTIENIYSHDNITGMIVQNTTRNITISNSRFVNNDVNNVPGADGILFHRSVIGIILDNCDLSYNGEHGIYFQGQNATITNNRVFGNNSSGLKFGCYDDQNYEYEGEPIDKWVTGYENIPGYEGVLGANGFGMKNIVISNNIIGAQANGGSGIYFQPSVKGLLISNNAIYDTGINIVFFNYGNRLEIIKDVTICNNKIENGNISCQVNEKCLINENTVINGNISTFCANNTTPPYMNNYAKDYIVSNNIADGIVIERTSKCIVSKNNVKNININTNNENLTIDGNVVTEQTSYKGKIISIFKNNTITMKDNNAFFITDGYYYASFPLIFTGNKIVLASKGDYPIGDVEQGAADNRIIANNYIELASGYFIMRLYGNNNRVTNNTFIMQNAEGGNCLRIYGSKNVITENTCICAGNGIQLSTDANHIVKNNIAVVNSSGSTNIVADNVAP